MKNLLKKFTPKFLISAYHYFLAFLGAFYYHFPSWKIRVIGITGTKGKSSTLFLTAKILEAAGHRVNWISSLTIKRRDQESLNLFHMTMPGRFYIHKALSEAVKFGCDYFLIEVTSEGIKQHRHRFIDFDTAVFTNLAPEHIEAHGGFENYKKAKSQLFQGLRNSYQKTIKGQKIPKTIIANIDDKNCDYFLKFWAEQKIGFGLNPKTDYVKLCNQTIIPSLARRNKQSVEGGSNNQLFTTPLLGEFNFYNCLAAYTISFFQKINKEIIKSVLSKIDSIPGRMEEIKAGQKSRVFVDYAHTPDSFKQVFETIDNIKTQKSKIIAVFGATGGGRDKWKRPEMGKIAAQYSDFIILTSDDSYDENSQEIINDIMVGIKGAEFSQKSVFQISDRRLAIRQALKLTKQNDLVIILGKGSETTQIIGDKQLPWSDKKVIQEELKLLLNT